MKLFITRHGHRNDDWDVKGVPNGVKGSPHKPFCPAARPLDPDISSVGEFQATDTGKYLKDKDIKVIYASPFFRTVHTAANIAAEVKAPVRLEWGVAEAFYPPTFSLWPGTMCDPMLKKTFPCIEDHPQTGVLPVAPEDQWQTHERAKQTTKILVDRHPNENILIVTHGALLIHIPITLAGWGVADYNCPLCGLTEMSNDDGSWKVVKSADVSHLQWTKV